MSEFSKHAIGHSSTPPLPREILPEAPVTSNPAAKGRAAPPDRRVALSASSAVELMGPLSVDPASADPPEEIDPSGLDIPPGAPPEVRYLRVKQREALELMMEGQYYASIAQEICVDRRTIYRWATQDPAFMRARDQWRSSVLCSARDRLVQSAEEAAMTLGQASLDDYRAAAILLKGAGVLGAGKAEPARPASDGSSIVEFLNAIPPEKRQQFELRLRELVLSFKEEAGAD